MALTLDDTQALYIAFQEQAVAVCSDTPEVLEGLKAIFHAMLVRTPPNAVARLKVCRNERGYDITGDTAIAPTAPTLPEVLRCLRFSVIRGLIHARPELLWFHAGAAALKNRAMILAGTAGRGKSTLVTALCARGWSYLSDDVVPVDPTSNSVAPFPLMPARRECPGHEMPENWLRLSSKVAVSLPPGTIRRAPVPIGALVLPKYRFGVQAELSLCRPAEAAAEFLQHCWNSRSHREAAMPYLCELVARLPAFHLSFSNGNLASDLLIRSVLV
jgi:hypothetical protein